MLSVLVFFGTLAAAWYLLITRPQRQQEGRHQRVVGQLSVGSHVMTVGGLYGRVQAIEGRTAVVELSPGISTRINTDGIAKVVAPADAPLPAAGPATPMVSTHADPPREHAMNHHPQQGQPHAQPPQPHAQPPQPYGQPPQPQYQPQPQGYPAPMQQPHGQQQVVQFDPRVHVPQQVRVAPPAPSPLGYASPAPGQVTLRAGAPSDQYAAQPWQASSITGTAHVPAQPGQPYQFSLGSLMPQPGPQHGQQPAHHYQQPHGYAPQQQPYAPQPYAPQPYAPQPYAPQPYAQQPYSAQPAYAAAPAPPYPPQQGHQPHPYQTAQPMRATSAAPQGMGSAVRRDDPALQQAFERARDEREQLAEEYRRFTAPMVDPGGDAASGDPSAPPVYAAQQMAEPTTHQLFVAAGAPAPQAGTVFPAPARLPDATPSVPRPGIQVPQDIDLQTSAAFQRRAPYAAEPQPLVAG